MRKVFPLLVIALFLSSCLKQEEFPNRPDIEYLGFVPNTQATSKFDSLGFVKFSFTDGDGDLGLGDSDNESPFALGDPYYFNLFVRYFERQNGTFVEVIPPGIINVRFERLTSEGGNGSLQGEMNVGIRASGISPFDTVRYEMYIVDRALNHSDTIMTEPLVFSF
jgi:hypothetical protein